MFDAEGHGFTKLGSLARDDTISNLPLSGHCHGYGRWIASVGEVMSPAYRRGGHGVYLKKYPAFPHGVLVVRAMCQMPSV